MRIFFDNCTAPACAEALDGFVRHLGHSAHHIRDLPCGRNATDLQGIAMLAEDRGDWFVVTGDTRIQRNAAERAAYRHARLKGFVLAPAFQKHPTFQVASILIWRFRSLQSSSGAGRTSRTRTDWCARQLCSSYL